MFIVTIENDGVKTEIHGESERLMSGKVVKGINSIDTLSFSMLPSNAGFNKVRDFTTLVTAYNTSKERYEFYGRVLYSDTSMDENGLITKEVTCESYFGYLCDSTQAYFEPKNWTVSGLLNHLINAHNSQVEEYKRFTVGEVDVTDPNDNLYLGIQRENTWEALKSKLLDTLGGEFRFRVEDGMIYLDYLTEIGKTSTTEIAVSRNMKAIKQEKDPSAYVTRLIPYGCKLGQDTEQRLDITSVNDGKNYIDDPEAIAVYGLHVNFQEWDDVTTAANLLAKGKQWLAENNKVKIKYTITALDLSLLGLDVDDFEVCDYYPIKNPLLGIDDVARIIKKNIDVCEEIKSTIEVGENFKTLSDLQIEQTNKAVSSVVRLSEKVAEVESVTATNSNTIVEVDDRVKVLEEGGIGEPGEPGEDGATFTPSVDADGNLSWTNDKGLDNPETVNIKGKDGKDGEDGLDGDDGKSAYEYAQDGGFTGTEEEFAEMLAGGGGGSSGGLIKLWDNASPTSAFAAQTITFPDNNCPVFFVEWVESTSGQYKQPMMMMRPGDKAAMHTPSGSSGYGTGGLLSWYRFITASTQTSMTFGAAFCNGAATQTGRTDIGIPVAVYGANCTN